ncbi:bifunctional N-acetylglucosamine-1-phosphate uridyltransferase/glucosamine-1-phosphate acetyltransferase, partial [bacterium]|nr:bifunctional N-acetylglucosamine-1-phosphate uridyltransferase/glucosamine-1-phosphate acetyltransferase [bacterium]
PNVFLEGTTKIGKHCKIGIGSVIINSTIGDSVLLKPYSVLENCSVKSGSEIGPFSRLRPGAQLDQKVKVGNFVEIKKSHLKEGVKANHLTYIGDSVIGKKTNVGCGTITCNYDGRAKHKTIIGDDVFIGSDVQFVAPVKVGRGATIAAGSTITDDVPADALGIAREKQINKKNWKPKKNS